MVVLLLSLWIDSQGRDGAPGGCQWDPQYGGHYDDDDAEAAERARRYNSSSKAEIKRFHSFIHRAETKKKRKKFTRGHRR